MMNCQRGSPQYGARTRSGYSSGWEPEGAMVWHVNRLMRLPRDLERLLEFSDRGLALGYVVGFVRPE